MYKLTVISGPNRGTSYPLQDGALTIGRQAGNTVVLQSSKVSKRHCTVTVRGTEITIQDEGSSNGTFINGILTKTKKLKVGDRISVGEFVFALSEPTQKVAKVASAIDVFGGAGQLGGTNSGVMAMPGMSASGIPTNQPPKNLKEKILWAFENQFMPIIYNLNLKNEWKLLCVAFFTVFVLANLVVSINPLMESNRVQVINEIGRRASFMAKQIAERNAPFLAAHAETKAEIGMAENAEGVRLALIIDLDNRILAPAAKFNQYLTSGVEAVEATKARDLFRSGKETGFRRETDSSTLIAFEPIKILNPALGRNVIVAMAIVSIDTSLATPDLGEIGVVYSEALIMSALLGAVLLLILYRMTLKPFEVLNEDLDKALKGDITQVTREFKFPEMNPLWDLINSAIQRIPRADASPLGVGINNGAQWAEESIGPLRMLGGIAKFGLVVFDSDQKIIYLNPLFEEISGIREDGAIGRQISEVARDQAMGVFTNDILSRAPAGGEGISEDFDFSGVSYKMYAAAFGHPGNSAKAYILGAVKTEG